MAKNPSEPRVSALGRVGAWVATPQLRVRLGIRAVLVFAVLLFIYYVSTAPRFFSVTNATNLGARTAPDIILAVGQTMVIIQAGIDLSVGAVLAFSGSLASVAYCYWGLPVWPAMLLGLAAGALLGFINGLIITKGRIPDFIATLGMMVTARGVALILTGGLPVPSHLTAITLKAYLPQEIIWLGSGDILGFPTGALIALLIVAAGWVILMHTGFGRALFAVGGNREAARVSGINVDRTKIMTYTLMGLLAALAGLVLVGRMNSANALMGDGTELQSIAAVVIGGTNLFGGEGGVIGSLLGALIMGILRNVLNLHNMQDFAQRVVMGLLIIGVVLFDQLRRRYGA
ncbi:MAG TPA: permease [Chloroflexi bacterium]|nr:permease [Chloroflexota bacterium]